MLKIILLFQISLNFKFQISKMGSNNSSESENSSNSSNSSNSFDYEENSIPESLLRLDCEIGEDTNVDECNRNEIIEKIVKIVRDQKLEKNLQKIAIEILNAVENLEPYCELSGTLICFVTNSPDITSNVSFMIYGTGIQLTMPLDNIQIKLFKCISIFSQNFPQNFSSREEIFKTINEIPNSNLNLILDALWNRFDGHWLAVDRKFL